MNNSCNASANLIEVILKFVTSSRPDDVLPSIISSFQRSKYSIHGHPVNLKRYKIMLTDAGGQKKQVMNGDSLSRSLSCPLLLISISMQTTRVRTLLLTSFAQTTVGRHLKGLSVGSQNQDAKSENSKRLDYTVANHVEAMTLLGDNEVNDVELFMLALPTTASAR